MFVTNGSPGILLCEIDNFESSDIQISCKIQNLHLELINSPVEPNQDLRVVYKL